jgi:hypothetical protein
MPPRRNLWDIAKAFLKWNLIAIIAYIKKKSEIPQINNIIHLKVSEKQEQAKPKINRGANNKAQTEINKMKTKRTV